MWRFASYDLSCSTPWSIGKLLSLQSRKFYILTRSISSYCDVAHVKLSFYWTVNIRTAHLLQIFGANFWQKIISWIFAYKNISRVYFKKFIFDMQFISNRLIYLLLLQSAIYQPAGLNWAVTIQKWFWLSVK